MLFLFIISLLFLPHPVYVINFQFYILTPAKLRLVTLCAFIIWKCRMSEERKILIFCATQDMVDFHTELLSLVLGMSDYVDVSFFKLHGSMTQKVR